MIEEIQLEAAQTATGAKRRSSYAALYFELGSISLYDRRKMHKMCKMDEKLVHRIIKVNCGLSNKRRRIKRPYWNDRLTELWNDLITTQRAAGRTR